VTAAVAPEPDRPRSTRSALDVAAWLLGSALALALAAAGCVALVDQVEIAVRTSTERDAVAAAVAVILYGLVAIVWLLGIRFAARRLGWRWTLSIGLLVTAVLRASVALAIDPPAVGDALAYGAEAERLAESGLRLAAVAPGYPAVLSAVFGLLGSDTALAAGILNLILELVAAGLLFSLLHHSIGLASAGFGLAIFAILPAGIFVTAATTPAPMAMALLLLAAWCVAVLPDLVPSFGGRALPRLGWATGSAGLAGLALAAFQYVEPVGLALLLPFVLVVLGRFGDRAPRRAAAALCVAFLIGLIPAIVANAMEANELSVETTTSAGWRLAVGTDPDRRGGLDGDDLASLESRADGNVRRASGAAGRDAFERLLADPGPWWAIVDDKLVGSWGADDLAARMVLVDGRERPFAAGFVLAATLASQLAWTIVLLAAPLGILRAGPRLPTWLLIGILSATALATVHAFTAVGVLDHLPITGFAIGAAAIAFSGARVNATRES
jgi:hypothetical protein